MKPRRFHGANFVFRLEGGNEDNDLWVERMEGPDGEPLIGSVWEPTDEERARIAAGENVALVVWGTGHPPVALAPTPVPLGKGPGD